MRQYFISIFPLFLILHEGAIYLSNDMYLPAMPDIAAEMGSKDLVQNTLTMWILGSGSLQLILGPLSDRFGRRPILLLGAIVFVFTSLVCASTTNIYTMLFARFLQGATAGTIYIAGHSIIHETYDDKKAIRLFALMGMITVIAPALGPLVGALIMIKQSWRDVFLVLFYFGLINIVALIISTPETLSKKSSINIKHIMAEYKKIVINRSFMKLCAIFGLLVMNFISWNMLSPFIVMETLGQSKMVFAFLQIAIFGGYIIGAAITRSKIKTLSAVNMAKRGVIVSFFGALSLFVFVVFEVSIFFISLPILLLGVGSAMAMSPINRMAINASAEATGKKIAIFSSVIGVFGGIFGGAMSLLDNKDFFSLSLMILLYASCTYVIYHINQSRFSELTKT